MRKEKLNLALKVRDLRNGRFYKVTGPDTVAQIDEDDNIIEGGEVVTITEDNCRCFTTVGWAPETLPEGYEVDAAGQIVKDSSPVTAQGEIKVDKIIARVPGALVLQAKRGDKTYLMTYRVNVNKFIELTEYNPENGVVCVIETLDDSVILGLNEYKVVERSSKEDPEKLETVTVLDYAAVLRVYAKSADQDRMDYPINFDLCELVGNRLYVGSNVSADNVDEQIPVVYSVFDIRDMDRQSETIKTGSAAQFGKSVMGLCVIAADRIIANDTEIVTPEAAKLTGYKYIIDVSEDPMDGVFEVYLANDDRQVKKITRKSTPDRGYIITVSAA